MLTTRNFLVPPIEMSSQDPSKNLQNDHSFRLNIGQIVVISLIFCSQDNSYLWTLMVLKQIDGLHQDNVHRVNYFF